MIFVTVGAQLPFDRLVRVVDQWAAATNQSNVFAQIGAACWKPKHIQWKAFLRPGEFQERVASADLIVAHAGVGSILAALERGKPIVVMPRRAKLKEHRNDHQVAMAERFAQLNLVSVVSDEADFAERLQSARSACRSRCIAPKASPELIDTIGSFFRQVAVEAQSS